MAALMHVSDPDLLHEIFDTAQHVKQAIYGRRLVIFAPLYVSNMCANECTYCAFPARNTELERRALTQEEIARERGRSSTRATSACCSSPASPTRVRVSYVLKSIETSTASPMTREKSAAST